MADTRVYIFDTTLRDGEQSPGCSMNLEEKLRMAHQLERLQVDRFGLDEVDRRILAAVLDKFDGGPVGLGTLAAAVGEDPGTIEDIYEPYLLQIGFLDRTPRGRRVTRRAREHLRGSAPSTLF